MQEGTKAAIKTIDKIALTRGELRNFEALLD
jgi:hypothetical protein